MFNKIASCPEAFNNKVLPKPIVKIVSCAEGEADTELLGLLLMDIDGELDFEELTELLGLLLIEALTELEDETEGDVDLLELAEIEGLLLTETLVELDLLEDTELLADADIDELGLLLGIGT